MQWSLIKTWAKDYGFTVSRSKNVDQNETDNPYFYQWYKTDDSNINGTTNSLSKLATHIYNILSDNKWVDHQKEYVDIKETKNFSVTDYER
jgi:hypothetical protein